MKFFRKIFAISCFLSVMFGILPALAGDSLFGKIIEVRSASVVVLDFGSGKYIVRLVGIETPKEGTLASKATQFVKKLVLGKIVHMRFESRNKNGEMLSKLFIGKAQMDVGLELVKAGLARRLENYDYKYSELSKAEAIARKQKRGLWAK
jgi:endonuclease YncB( thermonuclease family)